jgi:hypothetical protein
MIVAATFLTTHFGEWRASWHGVSRTAQTGAPILNRVPEANEGLFVLFDWSAKAERHRVLIDTPAGFVFGAERLYVNSMYGNRVLVLDERLRTVDAIGHRLMNDLHSLAWSDDRLLLTSSGVDGILELTRGGVATWIWLATDHGYTQTPSGRMRRSERSQDFRLRPIATAEQATHCNSAIDGRWRGRPVVLASLFHQGEVVAIDRQSGRVEVLANGFRNPHSIRRWDGGWMVSDSRSNEVTLLTDEFDVADVISGDFSWVQDVVAVDGDHLLIADANHSRMVLWDLHSRRVVDVLQFLEEWKIYQMEIVPAPWVERLTSVARSDTASI